MQLHPSNNIKAHPDGLCISACAAGQDVNEELMKSVKEYAPNTCVLCNTGCRTDTIEAKLKSADAAIVGTFFKHDGKLEDCNLQNVRIDKARVKSFMDLVKQIRKNI